MCKRKPTQEYVLSAAGASAVASQLLKVVMNSYVRRMLVICISSHPVSADLSHGFHASCGYSNPRAYRR